MERFNESRQAAVQALADIEKDAERLREKKEHEERRKAQRRRLWRFSLGMLLAACLAVMVFQSKQVLSALRQKDRPLRQGSFATDPLADRCVENLWRISARLQRMQPPGSNFVCPASGKPYGLTRKNNNMVVRCPNPGKHGLAELRVDRINPVPKVVK